MTSLNKIHFDAFLICKFHPTNITLLLTHWPTHHHISWRKKSPSYIFVVFTIIVVSSGFCFKSFLSFSNYVPFCATIWLFICVVHAISFRMDYIILTGALSIVIMCMRLSIKIWRVNGNIHTIKVKMWIRVY